MLADTRGRKVAMFRDSVVCHSATVFDDKLYLDMQEVTELPYRADRRGRVFYYPGNTDTRIIERYMRAGDFATSSGDMRPTFHFVGFGKDKVVVAPFSKLGLDDMPLLYATATGAGLMDSAESEGYTIDGSITAVCGQVMKRAGIKLRQLQPRYRWLAHSCIHQGPMVCVAGSSANAVQWDRVGAFLGALRSPVPVPDSLQINSPNWRRVRRLDGFVSADVEINDSEWSERIPPLPVRTRGRVINPTGRFTGQWTIPMLREAEEYGVKVVKVHECVTCDVANIHEKAADIIDSIKDKRLRKAVYLRYWGRMANRGGMIGTSVKPKNVDRSDVFRFRWSSLFWMSQTDEDSYRMFGDYRPDHSAYIASSNSMVMARELSMRAKGEVVAAHIDAIWTEGGKPDGDWKAKSSGPVRFYGVGTYNHSGKMGAMGYKGDSITDDDLAAYGSRMQDRARDWHGGILPGENPLATSDPICLDTSETFEHASVYDRKWSVKGWLRREVDCGKEGM